MKNNLLKNKKLLKNKPVFLFLIVFIILFCIFMVKIVMNKTKDFTRPSKEVTSRIDLITTIPKRGIHLNYDKNYDVIVNLDSFVEYANKEAKVECNPDRLEYGKCQINTQCLNKFNDKISKITNIDIEDLEDMFSISNFPDCVYDGNPDRTLPGMWKYWFIDYREDKTKWTVVNKNTGKTLNYLVEKYVDSGCEPLVSYKYYDQNDTFLFQKTDWYCIQ